MGSWWMRVDLLRAASPLGHGGAAGVQLAAAPRLKRTAGHGAGASAAAQRASLSSRQSARAPVPESFWLLELAPDACLLMA